MRRAPLLDFGPLRPRGMDLERVLHSLVQATVNKVIVRFAVFALSSAVLMALVALAARAVFLGATA